MYKLAEILKTPITDLLDVKAKNIYHQHNKDNAIGHQEIENLYQENKEKTDTIIALYEARLKDKDALIAHLTK